MERDEVVSAEGILSYAMDDWTDRMDNSTERQRERLISKNGDVAGGFLGDGEHD
jgi:hypothetical protein